MPSFESIEEDFLRISAEVAWASVATVDLTGRPRRLGRYEPLADEVEASALRLDPWKVMVLTSEDVAAGRFYKRDWRDGE